MKVHPSPRRLAVIGLAPLLALSWAACSDSPVSPGADPPWPGGRAVIDTVYLVDTVSVVDTVIITSLAEDGDTTRLAGALAWGGGPGISSSSHLVAGLPDGVWGIGTNEPAARLHVADGELRVDHGRLRFLVSGAYQGDDPAGFGLSLDRESNQGQAPMGVNFQQDGENLWGLGMDERTELPHPDYVSVFESGTGDVFRFRTGGRAILGKGIGHPEAHHVLTVQDKDNDFIENVLNLYMGPTGHGIRYIRAFDGHGIPFAVGRDGRVGVGGDVSASAMLAVRGDVEGRSFRRVSDERLKEEIRPLGRTLPDIRRLDPVLFRWRDGATPPVDEVGLVAQEVEALFPEVVRENAEGLKTVDYQAVSLLLLKAVKELADQVDAGGAGAGGR